MTLKVVRVVGPMQSGRTSIVTNWYGQLAANDPRSVMLERGNELPPEVPEGTLTVVYDPPHGIEDDEIDALATNLQQQGVRYLILTQYCTHLAPLTPDV